MGSLRNPERRRLDIKRERYWSNELFKNQTSQA